MLEVQRAAEQGRGFSLRLTAYRFDVSGDDQGPRELFPCEHLCRRSGSARLDPDVQASRNCALPGFDRRRWTGDLVQLQWMGRPRRLDIDERGAEERPPEEPENGCPGAWYRTPFLESVLRYRRRLDGNGGRVSNRLLDLCTDEVVIEAVETIEGFEDAWRSEWDAARWARMRKDSQP